MDYVSTAEDDAAGHDGGDARAERNSPVGVAQAGRRRVKLLKSKPKKSELKNPELKKGRQPCAECLCKGESITLDIVQHIDSSS